MKTLRQWFEISIVLTVLVMAGLAVYFFLEPIDQFQTLMENCGYFLTIFLPLLTMVFGKFAKLTKQEYFGYISATFLLVGLVCIVFGGVTGLVKSADSAPAHDHFVVCAVGYGMLGISWLIKKLAKVSCMPQVKSMLSQL